MKAILVPGILMLLVGCLSPAEPSRDAADSVVRFNGNCDNSMGPIRNCSETGPDEEWVVEDVNLENLHPSRNSVAVHILNLDRDFRISNVSISGFDYGIIVDQVQCSNCRLTLQNVTLAGPGTVDDYAEPMWSSRPQAVLMLQRPGSASAVELVASRVEISDFAGGVQTQQSASLTLDDVSIDCLSYGIEASGATGAQIRNSNIQNCSQAALAYAGRGNVLAENVSIANSANGILMSLHSTANVGTLRNVRVHGSERVGGTFLVGSYEILESVFESNGNSTPPSGPADCPDAAICTMGVTMAIHQSSFTSNLDYAVASWSGLDQIDASQNWWASATGPRIRDSETPTTPTIGVGEGEIVTSRVSFIPFLTGPP